MADKDKGVQIRSSSESKAGTAYVREFMKNPNRPPQYVAPKNPLSKGKQEQNIPSGMEKMAGDQ